MKFATTDFQKSIVEMMKPNELQKKYGNPNWTASDAVRNLNQKDRSAVLQQLAIDGK